MNTVWRLQWAENCNEPGKDHKDLTCCNTYLHTLYIPVGIIKFSSSIQRAVYPLTDGPPLPWNRQTLLIRRAANITTSTRVKLQNGDIVWRPHQVETFNILGNEDLMSMNYEALEKRWTSYWSAIHYAYLVKTILKALHYHQQGLVQQTSNRFSDISTFRKPRGWTKRKPLVNGFDAMVEEKVRKEQDYVEVAKRCLCIVTLTIMCALWFDSLKRT